MDIYLLIAVGVLILIILLQDSWMDGAKSVAPPNGHGDSGSATLGTMLGILAFLGALMYALVR